MKACVQYLDLTVLLDVKNTNVRFTVNFCIIKVKIFLTYDFDRVCVWCIYVQQQKYTQFHIFNIIKLARH